MGAKVSNRCLISIKACLLVTAIVSFATMLSCDDNSTKISDQKSTSLLEVQKLFYDSRASTRWLKTLIDNSTYREIYSVEAEKIIAELGDSATIISVVLDDITKNGSGYLAAFSDNWLTLWNSRKTCHYDLKCTEAQMNYLVKSRALSLMQAHLTAIVKLESACRPRFIVTATAESYAAEDDPSAYVEIETQGGLWFKGTLIDIVATDEPVPADSIVGWGK